MEKGQQDFIFIGRQGKKSYARQKMASSKRALTQAGLGGEMFMGLKIHDYIISIASP